MSSVLSKKMRLKAASLHIATIAMLSSPAHAMELTDDLAIHGFVSQAFIDTSGNSYFGRSEDGSFDFREIGINGYWQAHKNINFAAQLISRNAGRESDSDPRVDFALADFHTYSDFDTRFGMRLGRIKIPLGLYNTTRDAPSARNGIFAPASVYFEQFRNALVSTDGGSVYASLNRPWGDLAFEFYAGTSDPGDEEMEYYVFKQATPGHFEDASMHGGQVMYDALDSGLRLALSYTRPSLDYQRQIPFNPLAGGHVISDMLLYSGQYNTEFWTFTAEYLLMINNVKGFGPAFEDFRTKGESYYAQVDYRYRPDLTFSVRYGEQIVNDEDRDGDKKFTTPHVGFGKNWMLGAQWDFAPGWIIRAEYHRTDGTAWLSGADNPVSTDTRRKWETYAVQLVYSF